MRPIDVLRSATSNAAQMIGTPDRGVLAPGDVASAGVGAGRRPEDRNRPLTLLTNGLLLSGAILVILERRWRG
jgi:imidazolonepropionase-like amidohydrolase